MHCLKQPMNCSAYVLEYTPKIPHLKYCVQTFNFKVSPLYQFRGRCVQGASFILKCPQDQISSMSLQTARSSRPLYVYHLLGSPALAILCVERHYVAVYSVCQCPPRNEMFLLQESSIFTAASKFAIAVY